MSNPQFQVMHDALHGYKQKFGQPAVRSLLERVAGVSAASQVAENYMQRVISACVENRTYATGKNNRSRGAETLVAKAYARWNNPKRRELTE